MRTRFPALFALAGLCLALVFTATTRGQDDGANVALDELRQNPQRYWARSIVFRDVLESSPKGRAIRLEGGRYTPFVTSELGTCYAASDIVDALGSLPLESECLFGGTILQHRGKFFVVVQSVITGVDTKQAEALIDVIGNPALDSARDGVKTVASMLDALQRVHFAYARKYDVPVSELYNPESEHYSRAIEYARTAVSREESSRKTSATEILAQYLFSLLSDENALQPQPLEPAPVIEETPAPEPEPVVKTISEPKVEQPELTDDELAEPVIEEAPRRPTWRERRTAARAEKAARKQEKLRQAEERKLAREREKAEQRELNAQRTALPDPVEEDIVIMPPIAEPELEHAPELEVEPELEPDVVFEREPVVEAPVEPVMEETPAKAEDALDDHPAEEFQEAAPVIEEGPYFDELPDPELPQPGPSNFYDLDSDIVEPMPAMDLELLEPEWVGSGTETTEEAFDTEETPAAEQPGNVEAEDFEDLDAVPRR